jgi:excisionase family DNA binding protein
MGAVDLLSKPTLNVPELAVVLGVGKNTAYEMVRTGQVRVLRVGRRIVVPSSAVRELLGDV